MDNRNGKTAIKNVLCKFHEKFLNFCSLALSSHLASGNVVVYNELPVPQRHLQRKCGNEVAVPLDLEIR